MPGIGGIPARKGCQIRSSGGEIVPSAREGTEKRNPYWQRSQAGSPGGTTYYRAPVRSYTLRGNRGWASQIPAAECPGCPRATQLFQDVTTHKKSENLYQQQKLFASRFSEKNDTK
jgi:hypothetical protein